MKNRLMSILATVVVAICVFGPNIPSCGYTYAPEIPEDVKKLIREN